MADHWYDRLRGDAHPEPERPGEPAEKSSRERGADMVAGIDRTGTALADFLQWQTVLLERLDQQVARLEDERRAREDLSERIDQLAAAVEELRGSPSMAQATAQMVRNDVADEIRPLLVAIVELLELGVGQGRGAEPACADASDDLIQMQDIELPKILTRPLDDLLTLQTGQEPPIRSGSTRRRDEASASAGRLFGRRAVRESADSEPASRRKGTSPWTPFKS